MVAYSFNPQFEGPIKRGLKTQTIRAPRARHARVGEALQLFVGMRTKHCRKIIPDQICAAVMPIEITFTTGLSISAIRVDDWAVRDPDAFARRDGFADLEDMAAFWRRAHRLPDRIFRGVVIEWYYPKHLAGMLVSPTSPMVPA